MARRNIQMQGKGVQGPAPVDYSAMPWPELRKVAKARGVSAFRKSRDVLEAELKVRDIDAAAVAP